MKRVCEHLEDVSLLGENLNAPCARTSSGRGDLEFDPYPFLELSRTDVATVDEHVLAVAFAFDKPVGFPIAQEPNPAAWHT
jgi:hypothetical protein